MGLKKKHIITLCMIFFLVLSFRIIINFKHINKIKNEKDNVSFLTGAWISDVKLPMSATIKGQFYRLGMGEDKYFKYGQEQVELIFRAPNHGKGNIDGDFVKLNTQYYSSSKTDSQGFRHVKFIRDNSEKQDVFKYKVINNNKIEMRMIYQEKDAQQQNFKVYFIRENKKR